ncbi:hypothetical protein AVEN_80288-1 [Araneus ventricosus]|uniref:Uncharacterized protein n=1 Tax=Araneus ventricosus TaxID=182803 RepID=A0A4Y2T3E1_ARAVE|nr:hypothetical protein AVEN_89809-1 [Araneus ventricosus]GBN93983.1 hypothetical protein AVEN_80288-1 [Araneus ventricosus]
MFQELGKEVRFFNEPVDSDVPRLANLMKFLKAEVEGEERLKLVRSGFDNTHRKEEYHVRYPHSQKSIGVRSSDIGCHKNMKWLDSFVTKELL